MTLPSALRRDESGYSMVEVLVAIFILTIAIVPMFTMFDMGLRTATTSSELDRARALAERQVELAQSRGSVAAGEGVVDGLRWRVEDPVELGFPKELESDASRVELCEVSEDSGGDCEAPEGGSKMYRMTVEVSREGREVFTTTGVVTER